MYKIIKHWVLVCHIRGLPLQNRKMQADGEGAGFKCQKHEG